MPDSDLSALKRIGDLRQRRQERRLQEAQTVLKNAETEKLAAEQEHQFKQSELDSATLASYSTPSSEQAWIWRSITKDATSAAEKTVSDKQAAEISGREKVRTTGSQLLKEKTKVEALDQLDRSQRKSAENKREEREAEEHQNLPGGMFFR